MDSNQKESKLSPLSFPSFWDPSSANATHVDDFLPLNYYSVQPGMIKPVKEKDPKAQLIEELPIILKNEKWLEAARLYEIWLAGKPHDLKPEKALPCIQCNNGSIPTPPGVELSWEWFLKFAEGQKALEEISNRINEYISLYKPDLSWTPSFVEQSRNNCVQECYWKHFIGLLKANEKLVLTELDPPEWKQNQLSDKLPPLYVGYHNPKINPYFTLNDFSATLGKYSLRIYMTGEAKPLQKNSAHREFSINNFLVRVNDSFDFYGQQYLGSWGEVEFDKINSIFNFLLDKGNFKPRFNSIRSLSNDDFRKYQLTYKKGTSFRVITPLKQILVKNLPLTVKIKIK